jgi:hypothetical protein
MFFYTGLQLGITLREEQWLRAFKRSNIIGDQRKLQIEVELHDLYSSSLGDQIKKNEMGGMCGTYRREKRCIQGCTGETGVKESTWKSQA